MSDPQLIEREALEALLADAGPALRLIHVGDAAGYRQAHLPGALLVEPAELVAGIPPATGKLPDLPRLNALFERLGYQPDCEFVLYDDEGGGWAGRFAWTLDIIGHRSWRYLDGGIHAWVADGGTLEHGAGSGSVPAPVRTGLELDMAPLATLDEVMGAIDDPGVIIWDVRSRAEYLGEKSGSARAGHIPGAVNLDWMALKDPHRQWRLVENLDDLLAGIGIDGKVPVITHCQTHHRSGLSYLIGRVEGFASIRAYDGSWSEWGNREDTPIVQGDS